MFDISFTEMLLIVTVALVVVGPKQLPSVARAIGILLAQLRRMATAFKADIQQEIEKTQRTIINVDSSPLSSEIKPHQAVPQDSNTSQQDMKISPSEQGDAPPKQV